MREAVAVCRLGSRSRTLSGTKIMTESQPNPVPSVGLVVADESLADRVREVLEASGFTLAFEVPLDDLRNGPPESEADVVVLAARIRSRDDSPFKPLRDRFPQQTFVAFAASDEAATLRWTIENGADGVVQDVRLEDTLAVTLRAVHAGQLVVPRDLRRRRRPPDLTNREKQVLSLVIMGLTNREIAQKLFISESTVKSHLNTGYRKLGVHSRAEAVRVIADPVEGFGTGILAITALGLARGRPPKS